MHLLKKAQIAYLKLDEASTQVFSKYVDYADVFSSKLAIKLSKYTEINNYIIKLLDDGQLPYGCIYSLEPMDLETLKIYIKNNLANNFIRPSKSFVKILIFFDKKPNGNLRWFIDYQSLNNQIIKNQYPLLLVGESLDQLDQA